jgi:hypothetical protein
LAIPLKFPGTVAIVDGLNVKQMMLMLKLTILLNVEKSPS